MYVMQRLHKDFFPSINCSIIPQEEWCNCLFWLWTLYMYIAQEICFTCIVFSLDFGSLPELREVRCPFIPVPLSNRRMVGGSSWHLSFNLHTYNSLPNSCFYIISFLRKRIVIVYRYSDMCIGSTHNKWISQCTCIDLLWWLFF